MFMKLACLMFLLFLPPMAFGEEKVQMEFSLSAGRGEPTGDFNDVAEGGPVVVGRVAQYVTQQLALGFEARYAHFPGSGESQRELLLGIPVPLGIDEFSIFGRQRVDRQTKPGFGAAFGVQLLGEDGSGILAETHLTHIISDNGADLRFLELRLGITRGLNVNALKK